MPAHRIDRWLDVAAESILSSVDVEFELIVVFDAVDPDPLPAWSADPRVRIARTAVSLGPAGTMRVGLELATGDYIARMDSDDRALPQRLATQLAFLETHPATVAVSARTVRIDEFGQVTGAIKLPAGDDVRGALLLQNVVPHATLVVRRAVMEQVGGYDDSLRQMEDYDFILRIAQLGPIAQLSEPLLEYRVHSSQSSRGQPPSGAHISRVLHGRRALARHLRRNRLTSEARNLLWLAAQHLRFRGVIRPGHQR